MGKSVQRAACAVQASRGPEFECKKLGVVFHTPENPTLGPVQRQVDLWGFVIGSPVKTKKKKSAPGPVRGLALKSAHLPVGPLFPFPECGKGATERLDHRHGHTANETESCDLNTSQAQPTPHPASHPREKLLIPQNADPFPIPIQ